MSKSKVQKEKARKLLKKREFFKRALEEENIVAIGGRNHCHGKTTMFVRVLRIRETGVEVRPLGETESDYIYWERIHSYQ